MKDHYTEADLLETWYTQPGESMPVMMHLADCRDCARRYESLERKMRTMHSCGTERPETFWARQRLAIRRRTTQDGTARPHVARFAAAAVVTLALGGLITWRVIDEPRAAAPASQAGLTAAGTSATTAPAEQPASGITNDPWQSEQLADFQSIVDWESWDEPSAAKGDQAL
jgi:hypothetical protein